MYIADVANGPGGTSSSSLRQMGKDTVPQQNGNPALTKYFARQQRRHHRGFVYRVTRFRGFVVATSMATTKR